MTPHGRIRGKPHLQRGRDGPGDLVLNREHVFHVAVKSLRPDVAAVVSGDQLAGDADAVAGLADTAFEDVRHTESLGDLANVGVLALEGEGGGTGDDAQIGDVRQHVDDLFGQAVAEVFLLLVAAHVGEGEHGDGGARGIAFVLDLLQGCPDFRDGLETRGGLLGETPPDDALQGR